MQKKTKTFANLPLVPEKKDTRRFSLLVVLLVLSVVKLAVVSFDTQEEIIDANLYQEDPIVGIWENPQRAYHPITFYRNGVCETLHSLLKYRKIGHNSYHLYSRTGQIAFQIQLTGSNDMKILSSFEDQDPRPYVKK